MNKEEVIKLLDDLGLDPTGEFDEHRYVVQLEDSDEYARYYTKLDEAADFQLVDASSISAERVNVLTYSDDTYKLKLSANFDDDYYTLSVEGVK